MSIIASNLRSAVAIGVLFYKYSICTAASTDVKVHQHGFGELENRLDVPGSGY